MVKIHRKGVQVVRDAPWNDQHSVPYWVWRRHVSTNGAVRWLPVETVLGVVEELHVAGP